MSTKKQVLPTEQKRKRLIKIQVNTNPHYGKKPEERTIKELITSGCIIVDKPSGPSSHQITAWVRDIFQVKKAGHGGTLDPRVTGMLPVALADGTRVLQVLLTAGKEYVAVMKLHKEVKEEKIRKTCASFVGTITQKPPVRSAVKRVKRQRQIYYLDILQIKDREVLFRVGCEAGTYIRTVCVDLGKKLGVGAQLDTLRRTKVGMLQEHELVNLQDVKDAYIFWKEENDDTALKQVLHPIEYLLGHIPKVIIRDSAVDAICHGADLAVPGLVEIDTNIKHGDHVAIMSIKGEGVAMGTALLSTEQMIEKDTGKCVTLDRVFMNKGTYPSIWKKG